ncbi:MAG TPA: heme-binding protein [Thermoleophilaceae bacterium]|nr:heme-binding protein [Thermoleophilaceae bacterium]
MFSALPVLGPVPIGLLHGRGAQGAGDRSTDEHRQVDAGGNLVSHVRMDGAWLGSIEISINKAFTARAFDMPTQDLAGESQSLPNP